MFFVIVTGTMGPAIARGLYGPFKSHDAAQRFAEKMEAAGHEAATRRPIPVD